MQSQTFTLHEVKKIASLAHIALDQNDAEMLASGFTSTMEVVDGLKKAHTEGMEATSQVTGRVNVSREDIVDESRMFTQSEALRNAHKTHDGYFVVDQVIEK
jgi:aspartyl-tRNA(Asn)/glutamyl-tRNA(Gln) amidotransferase subunit C